MSSMAKLTQPKLPLVPGHEIVGTIADLGDAVTRFKIGDRVGVPWLGWTCGNCSFCRAGQENLCDQAKFTGYTLDGGYSRTYAVADQRFCFPIPDFYSDAEAAPLLCAGLIGYRSLVKAGNGKRLGIYGFGAAAHRRASGKVSTAGNLCFHPAHRRRSKKFALDLGAVWAGGSERPAAKKLDAAIIFAPVGGLVPQALKAVGKGGTVVCGGIPA